MNKTSITCLFLDIGGVLLTNGWDHKARMMAAKTFSFDLEDMENRHHMVFDTYEIGKLTLAEYLEAVLFYKKRTFTQEQFQKFMFAQSKPFPDMIKLISAVKKKYGLKVVAVSNEGRELNEYRIKKFKLTKFIDFFVSSSFVHLRKPDKDIYRMAVDIAQVPVQQLLYIDDRRLFLQVAKEVGIKGFEHSEYTSTQVKLGSLGLSCIF